MIDSHVKLHRASGRGCFPLAVWLAVILPESGARIPLVPSPNLTVLKHPCALGAEQKPNAANAKLINRTPAAWASERHTMPRRKYRALYVSIVTIMLWCQWDMPLLALSSALLILFTEPALSKKIALINFGIVARGASMSCHIWKEFSAATQVDTFHSTPIHQHFHLMKSN